MPRVSLRRIVPALVALAALSITGCTNSHAGELLLADAPDPEGAVTDIAIYSVEPGEEADDSTIVARSALSPLDITTEAEYGQSWVNSLGRVWDGSVLLAYGNDEDFVLGKYYAADAETFDGRMAGVAVFDSVLTSANISALYAAVMS